MIDAQSNVSLHCFAHRTCKLLDFVKSVSNCELVNRIQRRSTFLVVVKSGNRRIAVVMVVLGVYLQLLLVLQHFSAYEGWGYQRCRSSPAKFTLLSVSTY